MGVVVQRHGDIGVAHDVLQRFGIHTGVCHTGAECVSEGVRGDVGQLFLVMLVLKLLSRGNVRFDLENLILMNVCISCLREVSNIFLLAFTARRCFWNFLVIVPSYPQGIANLLSQPERLQDLTAPHVL